MEVGEEQIGLGPGWVVIVEPGEAHALRDASDDFQMIIMMDRYVPDDKVICNE